MRSARINLCVCVLLQSCLLRFFLQLLFSLSLIAHKTKGKKRDKFKISCNIFFYRQAFQFLLPTFENALALRSNERKDGKHV